MHVVRSGMRGVVQVPLHNVSNAYAGRVGVFGRTVVVEACLQVTIFLEDGRVLPPMGAESFSYVHARGGIDGSIG